MKTVKINRLYRAFLIAIISLLLPGCSLLYFEQNPVHSDTGKARIGEAGGIISVGDSTSKISGVTINVPEGALDEEVEIEITEGAIENINGEAVQTVQFHPEGLEFSEPVIIGIPWSTNNQTATNSMIYYLNEAELAVEETKVNEVDENNKITYATVNHFSSYFNKRQYFSIDYDFMRSSNQMMAYGNLLTPLSQIKPKLSDSPYANAEEIVMDNDGMQNCFAVLYFNLWKKDKTQKNYFNHTARQDLYVKYRQLYDGYEVIVYRYDNPRLSKNQPIEVFRKAGLYPDQLTMEWLGGWPLVASFNQNCFNNEYYEVQSDDEFDVTLTWQLVKKFNPMQSTDVWTWGSRKTSSVSTFGQLQLYEGDKNKNNIIDEYEQENSKPLVPSNPQPTNYATNVPVNTSLSWACSDPDGDELTYNVYFGRASNPPYLGTASTASYSLDELSKQTTYYWYITAIDANGAISSSQIWEFTTEEESIHTVGCGGITTIEYEGKTYHSLEIGDQCWLKENLNVGTMINGTANQSDNGIVEKYCYNNDEANCDTYGGLYQWNELMQYTEIAGAKGICPSGWHVATEDEWKILEGTVDSQYGVGDPIWDNSNFRGHDAGKKLKAASGWFLNMNGTDDYGFSVYPAGARSSTNGEFSDRPSGTYIWTSSQSARFLAFNNDQISKLFKPKESGFSVRCIKD